LSIASHLPVTLASYSVTPVISDGLLVGPHSFFLNRRAQLITLTARHALPTMFGFREIAEAGGLMSYGASLRSAS
jgi:putative ABC transport system substrate-binding protein